MKLGAQFFSIRDRSTTPEDLYASFRRMKEIGYSVVQMSGVCRMEPERFKAYSEEFSLPITCTHNPYDRIVNDTDALIREHQIYGCPVIGIGSMPNEFRGSVAAAREFVKVIETPMKKIRDAGLVFAYHNHAFELEAHEDGMILDYLIDEVSRMKFSSGTSSMR